MSVLPLSSNAVVYAQFTLQGRWKRILIIAGLYGLAMAATIWMTTLGDDRYRPREVASWANGLTLLQILNLLVFGSFRVESAVRGDISSRMIESHRLMPAPPLGSILGYIFGAPLQAIVLGAVNFILGAVCCFIGNIPLDLWVLTNAMLFLFAVFVYSMITQFSFIARGGFLLLLIIGVVAISSMNGGALQLLPSASVLLFPVLSQASVIELLFNSGRVRLSSQIEFAYLSSVLAQASLGAIAVRIAVRRYTSASTIGLSPILGLLLLAVWVAMADVQLSSPGMFAFRRYYMPSYYADQEHSELVTQTVASIITALLLAMFPIASAARYARQWHRTGDPSTVQPRGQTSEVGTVLIAGAIVACVLVNLPLHFASKTSATLLTLLILAIFFTGTACLFSLGYFLKLKAWIFAGIWVFLTWVGPLIADGIYHAMTDTTDGDLSAISGLSPAGALAMIWSQSKASVQPGMIGQALLMMIPSSLLLLMHSRRRRAMARVNVISVS